MWEDLEEAWNYDVVARDRTNHLDEKGTRYDSLYPYTYPVPYPVSYTPYADPSPRRLYRRWASGWY
ncbi:MAG TPA: hypothetical protein VK191_16715 [Symbiobacteriaceae bacterium]|nr:hypothetical protein [Symbiobacteriaceae bacterium]